MPNRIGGANWAAAQNGFCGAGALRVGSGASASATELPPHPTSTWTAGPVTDGPIGWIDNQLVYQRVTADGTVEIRGLVWSGGVVSDVSFVGVSKQYLVAMPWGQELMVFEQNTGSRSLLPVGTKVDVSWHPEYAFLLDASQDVSAGIEED